MEKCSMSLAIQKCKLKPQWDTFTHLLEFLKFKRLKIPQFGKDVERVELLYITAGNGKCYNHHVNSMAITYKAKHTAQQFYPLAFTKGFYKLYPHNNLYINVHSSMIAKKWKLPKWTSTGE